ncbi:MAG: hypothetical protein WCG87_07560 [Bacteroidota bacterium]
MRKKIVRSIIATLICAAAITTVKAQPQSQYIEYPGFSLGMNFGVADLWGDVGTKSPITHYTNDKYASNMHYMGGLYVRYVAHPAIAMRLGINYGVLYANDNWNYALAKAAKTVDDDAYQRWARNQDIKDYTWEGSLLFEINPFRFDLNSNAAKRRGQLYFLGGVAAFHFKPMSTYVNRETGASTMVNIYDLNLEGQGVKGLSGAPPKYELWQLAIPLGVGYRWDIGEHLGLGIEYIWRMTMTDYLDGVSQKYIDPNIFTATLPADKAIIAKDMYDKSWIVHAGSHAPGELRGNSSNNDSYSTFSLTFFYKIKNHRHPWWGQGQYF